MPKITVLTLPDDARAALEKAAKHGLTYSFPLRCQAVLLKTDLDNKRTALAIAQQLGCCEMSVNDWIKRYQEQGLAGLQVKSGRGRKPILNKETDLPLCAAPLQAAASALALPKPNFSRNLARSSRRRP